MYEGTCMGNCHSTLMGSPSGCHSIHKHEHEYELLIQSSVALTLKRVVTALDMLQTCASSGDRPWLKHFRSLRP
eukprot:717027-Lingulodinium_polyedra.AAC.1